MPNERIVMYVAASCTTNPGKGTWAAVAEYYVNDELMQSTQWDGVINEEVSARRAEIMGMAMALNRLTQRMEVTVYMDSYYVFQCWPRLDEWASTRWMQPRNKGRGVVRLVPLPHADVWAEIHRLAQLHNIRFIYVKGDDKPSELKRAERLARKAARQL